MRHNVLMASLAAVTLAAGSSALAAPPDALWNVNDTFTDYRILAMDPTLAKADLADGSYTLSVFGETYELGVTRAPFFDGAVSIARLAADGTSTIEPSSFEPAVVTAVGVDRPDVDGLITVHAEGVGGVIHDGDHVIAFQPLSLLRPDAPDGFTVAYRSSDIVRMDLPHAHETLTAPAGMTPPAIDDVAPAGVGGPDRRVTLWADSQMSAQSGFATTISNAFYTMAFEYNRSASYYPGWTYTIVNNNIYTCYDAGCDITWGMSSSNSGTLLPQWGAQVPNNAAVGTAFDTASLVSGKTFESNILGRGYQPGRYNVNRFPGLASWSQALLLGHETGHNYNGDHGNRGTPSPGRATSSTHNHPYTVCDLSVPVLGCLQSHTVNDYYTHYTLMWPSLNGTSGRSEQFFDLGSANQAWMRACNNNSFTSGSYSPGNAGFGYYCLN